MKIYLKSGQVVELGDVRSIVIDCDREVKPFKYANDGDEVFGLTSYDFPCALDHIIEFYNDKNKLFACHEADIVAILETTNREEL